MTTTRKGSENRFPLVRLALQGGSPDTPPTGELHLTARESDGHVLATDDGGTTRDLTEAYDHMADATGAHAASAIGIVDAGGNFATSTVEGALAELIALIAAAGVAEILSIPTAETDDTLVLRPDGAGGVEWAADAGGPGGGGLAALDEWVNESGTTTDQGVAFSNVTRTGSGGPGGNAYLTGSNGSGSLYTILSYTGLTPGALLLFSAWVKTSSGGGTNLYIQTTQPVVRLPNGTELPGSWTQCQAALVVGDDGTMTLSAIYSASIGDMRLQIIEP